MEVELQSADFVSSARSLVFGGLTKGAVILDLLFMSMLI